MCCRAGADQLFQHIFQLFTQEYGDNSRRCLIGSQSVVISDIGCGFTKKICMAVYSTQNTGQDHQELNIFVRCLARIKQINAVICGDGPVVVLTGTIDSRKWFLMKKTLQSVTLCHLFQSLHNDLVVVCCYVALCIDRCQLMLCRCDFVVLCLCRNTQFPEFFVYFFHKTGNSLTNNSKIMVIELLTFRRHGTKECTSGKNQVFSL